MRALLGFAAASAALVAYTPAEAQSTSLSGFSSSSAFRDFRVVAPPPVGGVPLDVRRHGRHIRVGNVLAGGYGYGGYYDGDYDANRSFSPDKWNDWWHERPERAFPRWVRQNQRGCERMWYSGAGWRC